MGLVHRDISPEGFILSLVEGMRNLHSGTHPSSFPTQVAAMVDRAHLRVAQGVIDEVLQEEVPASFFCRLSGEVMTDPVLLITSGHTYERAVLAKHFREQVSATRVRLGAIPTNRSI
jgi:hypothetical protein